MQTYNPTLVTKGVLTSFLRALPGVQSMSLVEKLAIPSSSTTDEEKYAWLGTVPAMVEWDGTARFTPMSDTVYTIKNKKFTSGIVINRDQLADDQTGGLAMRGRQLARAAIGHANSLLINALIDGTTNLAYDGVALFHDAHPIRGQEAATQDNLLGGTGTTTAQIAADFATALATMANFKAENNEPFTEELRNLIVVAPWGIRKAMLEALKAPLVSNTTNVQVDGLDVQLIFSSRLADVNDWYLLNGEPDLRPLIFQTREPVTLEALDNPGQSDAAFESEQYKYKVRGRYNTGYAYWQSAVKTTNT